MVKRKDFRQTSIPRYVLKATRVHYMPGIPEDIVRDVVRAQAAEFQGGFGPLHTLWKERVVPILTRHNVPRGHYMVYRGFMNELYRKVIKLGTVSPDDLIEKWAGLGGDPTILREIADALLTKKEEHGGG